MSLAVSVRGRSPAYPRHVSSTCLAMVMGWLLRGAKMATVPVGRLRRCVWTGSVASVVMAVMVRLIVYSSFLPVFLRCPGVSAVGCFVCDCITCCAQVLRFARFWRARRAFLVVL